MRAFFEKILKILNFFEVRDKTFFESYFFVIIFMFFLCESGPTSAPTFAEHISLPGGSYCGAGEEVKSSTRGWLAVLRPPSTIYKPYNGMSHEPRKMGYVHSLNH